VCTVPLRVEHPVRKIATEQMIKAAISNFWHTHVIIISLVVSVFMRGTWLNGDCFTSFYIGDFGKFLRII
jgi:hypothetical protein